MGNAIEEQGVLLDEDENLKEAFVRHNLKIGGEVEGESEETRVRMRMLRSTHIC